MLTKIYYVARLLGDYVQFFRNLDQPGGRGHLLMLASEAVSVKVCDPEIATRQVTVKAPTVDFEAASEEFAWRCPVRVISTPEGCRVVPRR